MGSFASVSPGAEEDASLLVRLPWCRWAPPGARPVSSHPGCRNSPVCAGPFQGQQGQQEAEQAHATSGKLLLRGAALWLIIS